MNSGHSKSYRMKFQQDKSIPPPRLWMPVKIPNLEIKPSDSIPPIKIPSSHVNLVLEWAKGNLDLLIKLRDGEITGVELKKQMKTMKEIRVRTSDEA